MEVPRNFFFGFRKVDTARQLVRRGYIFHMFLKIYAKNLEVSARFFFLIRLKKCRAVISIDGSEYFVE